MSTNYKKNQNDSPVIMYIVAFIMFILLIFTIMSLMHDKSSPLYLNYDKEIYNANAKAEEKAEIKESKISKEINKPDFIDKTLDKMGGEVKYDKYKTEYDKYYAQQQKKRREEFEMRQKLVQKAQEQERIRLAERIKNEKAKIARMQKTVQNPTPPQPVSVQQPQRSPESQIVSRAMQNSPCSPQSTTAIVYFFHQNNTEPIELIFNNPNPSFSNGGHVKLVFGDLPREKRHILKKNMVNLNQILNRPQFTQSRQNTDNRRPDAALKVQSGVTTNCSPYESSNDGGISER